MQHARSKWIWLAVVAICPAFMNFDGCGGHSASGAPATGFGAQIVDVNPDGVTTIHNGGTISGQDNGDLSGATGNTRVFSGSSPVSVFDGRVPAFWAGNWDAGDFSCPGASGFWSAQVGALDNITVGQCSKPAFGGSFVFVNPSPSTLTITGSGVNASSGLPVLTLFDSQLHPAGQVSATSVASDGASAVFPFPQASGSPLPFGQYSFSVTNAGSNSAVGVGLLSLATNDTSKPWPFGVDAVDIVQTELQCDESFDRCREVSSDTTPTSITTYPTTGQICLSSGPCTQVGTTPVAVKAYGATDVSIQDSYTSMATTSGPAYAMVANYDSNTVSMVDLLAPFTYGNFPVLNTIPVGLHPVALALNPAQTKLYVANYGSASISEIDLTTLAVTRTAATGLSPLSLCMDPGGNALWVGGLNYIAKLDLSAFTITSTWPVPGQVSSLAWSAGQGSMVYSAVSMNPSQYQVQEMNPSTGAILGSYASMSAAGTTFRSDSPGYLLSSAMAVSANFNNRFAVSSTPGGFILIDLQTETTMLTGSTQNPVRSIAIDPNGTMIYVTVPESNSLISAPAPPASVH